MRYNSALSFVVNGLHSVTSQKTEFFLTTAVTTSNSALNIFIYSSEEIAIMRLDPTENLKQCKTRYTQNQNIEQNFIFVLISMPLALGY
jgi:hypothetical protein